MDITEVTVDELRTALRSGPLSRGELLFVVDIGASNTRLGLTLRGGSAVYIPFVKFSVQSIAELLGCMQRFSVAVGSDVCRRIVAAALNLPGPVQGAVGGPIANYNGATPSDKLLHLHALPQELCPLHHTIMLNDLEAGAYGVVAANHFKIFSNYFSPMWVGTAANSSTVSELGDGHCLVVAPGTGLGAALIQYHAFSGKYTVLPLEMGHTSVQSETERDFTAAYAQEMKRGPYAPEYDDVCSGRGLERLYRYVCNASKSAKEISELARRGDTQAMEAVRLYNKFLMRFLSQMAIGFVPRTMVLCGDNAVHNDFYYANPAELEASRKVFLDHSTERMGFMSRVTVMRQKQLGNFNLLGCLYASETAARKVSKL